MLEVIALVLGILIFVALAFAVILIPVRRRARRLRGELESQLGDRAERTANARGLGLESRGAGQVGEELGLEPDRDARQRERGGGGQDRLEVRHQFATDT